MPPFAASGKARPRGILSPMKPSQARVFGIAADIGAVLLIALVGILSPEMVGASTNLTSGDYCADVSHVSLGQSTLTIRAWAKIVQTSQGNVPPAVKIPHGLVAQIGVDRNTLFDPHVGDPHLEDPLGEQHISTPIPKHRLLRDDLKLLRVYFMGISPIWFHMDKGHADWIDGNESSQGRPGSQLFHGCYVAK